MGIEGIVSKRKASRYRSHQDRTTGSRPRAANAKRSSSLGTRLKENRFDGLYLGRQIGDALEYAWKGSTTASRCDQVTELQL